MLKHSWGIGVLALVGCSGDYPMGTSSGGSVPSFGEGPISGSAGAGFGGGQPPLAGVVFRATEAPKPVSGGTLLVMRDQKTAIVADPDHDVVLVVDLTKVAVTRTISLDAGSEPGRAADDAQGHVHLVLRGNGKLLTFDPQTGDVLGTRSVCAYPRGLAVADTEQLVHVACAEGDLVTLATEASNSTPRRSLELEHDLRDVVVAADGLWVSRFRSAEVLRLDGAGQLLSRTVLPSANGSMGESVSSVAWRMVPSPSGGVLVVHQRAFAGEVVPSPGGYSQSGVQGGIVQSAITTVSEGGVAMGTSVALAAPLPVDVAQSPVSGRLLVASAAIEHPQQPSFVGRSLLLQPSDLLFESAPNADTGFAFSESASEVRRGQLVAVAFAGDVPVMQYREPNSLVVGTSGLTLPGDSVEDTGNTLFHLETGSGLACASCHPEGQEDGRVWHFSGFGSRRTQSLRGGLLGTEPFHWDGAEADFAALTHDVMEGRMAGPVMNGDQTAALARYIDVLAPMPAKTSASPAAIEHGKALFNSATVGCATCHSGARFSNNQTMDVGSADGPLQVPGLLGLWARAPYLHDGCAKTLADRFTRCGNTKHGNVASLTSEDLGDLSQYLESL